MHACTRLTLQITKGKHFVPSPNISARRFGWWFGCDLGIRWMPSQMRAVLLIISIFTYIFFGLFFQSFFRFFYSSVSVCETMATTMATSRNKCMQWIKGRNEHKNTFSKYQLWIVCSANMRRKAPTDSWWQSFFVVVQSNAVMVGDDGCTHIYRASSYLVTRPGALLSRSERIHNFMQHPSAECNELKSGLAANHVENMRSHARIWYK